MPVEAAMAVYTKGYRLEAPDYSPAIIAEIMKACFATEPIGRPDFAAIIQYIRDMPQQYWESKLFPAKIIEEAPIPERANDIELQPTGTTDYANL
jgi:hypothetical protein